MRDVIGLLLHGNIRIVEQKHKALRGHRNMVPLQLRRNRRRARLLRELIGMIPPSSKSGEVKVSPGPLRTPAAALAALILRKRYAGAKRQKNRR